LERVRGQAGQIEEISSECGCEEVVLGIRARREECGVEVEKVLH
jgi:hypothetical protein